MKILDALNQITHHTKVHLKIFEDVKGFKTLNMPSDHKIKECSLNKLFKVIVAENENRVDGVPDFNKKPLSSAIFGLNPKLEISTTF